MACWKSLHFVWWFSQLSTALRAGILQLAMFHETGYTWAFHWPSKATHQWNPISGQGDCSPLLSSWVDLREFGHWKRRKTFLPIRNMWLSSVSSVSSINFHEMLDPTKWPNFYRVFGTKFSATNGRWQPRHFCNGKGPGRSTSCQNKGFFGWWSIGGFNPSEKYESQLGWIFPIYGKMKFMFQSTNQTSSY